MFLLAICLVGTAMALPAIRDAPALLEGVPVPVFVSHPQLIMPHAALFKLTPLVPLEFKIEPEPKGETETVKYTESAETNPEFPEKPKETPLNQPIPLDPEYVIVKVDFNPTTFIKDWIQKIKEFFYLKESSPPMYLYPGYAMLVDAKAKP